MKNLLVLDKEEYKENYSKYLSIMEKHLSGKNEIIFTAYEDKMIRKVRNFKYIGAALQHLLYWRKSYRYAKTILKGNYANIYCINPIVGIFLGLFNKKSKIILSGFLFEPKRNQVYYYLRKKLTRWSLKGIDTAVVYGSKEVSYYTIFFPETKFVFIKYGIDFAEPDKYEARKLPERYIFSGGGSNRDYKTLIRAYNQRKLSTLRLVIATQPWRLKTLDISNVIVLEDVVLENFGDVLRRADLLVLSLDDSDISVGHMVMFQAMSLGVPILVNDIAAIRDYVDENCVTFFESENQQELTKKIGDFYEQPEVYKKLAVNALKLYKNSLTFDALLNRLLLI